MALSRAHASCHVLHRSRKPLSTLDEVVSGALDLFKLRGKGVRLGVLLLLRRAG